MNHLDKLISQYCPNGVPFVRLGDGICIYTGEQLNRTFMLSKGIYPVVNGGIEASGFINKYNEEAQTITMSQGGASAGFVNFQNTRFWAGAHCYVIKPIDNNKIDNRYLFYYLKQMQFKLQQNQQGAGIPSVGRSLVHNMSIPLPPLPVQQEIVRILDSMTDLIANLDSEIATRQQQYAHYRDQLLTFGNNVPRKTLGEVGILIRGNGLQKKDFCKSGVGCIHYGQIYTQFGMFADKTISFVEPKLAEKLTKVNTGDIIMATTGENVEDICKAVCWLGKESIVSGAHAVVYKHHQNPKYIAYCLHTQDFYAQKTHYAYGAKVIDIRTDKLASITIPLPPLSVQQKIVAKLDAFESLLATLRRECTLRQQQYEYYRERLLSFKETK